MQAVLGFIDRDACRRIHHRIGRLDVATQRQAMAEQRVVGQRHLGLVDDEVLVRIADRLLIGPSAEIRNRAPAFRVDDMCAAIGLRGIVADRERAAVLLDVLPREIHVALIEHIFRRRAEQRHVHAVARRDHECRVGDRRVQRARMISPRQHVFAALEIAEMLLQREDVRELLARMRDRLHVDDRHRRVFRERFQHAVLTIKRPVLEFRKCADADQVDVPREHARDFGDVLFLLAVHDRAGAEFDRPRVLAGREHDRVAAELERAKLEARARAHRSVEEQERDRFAFEIAADPLALERGGVIQQRVELGAAPVLRVEKMPDRPCRNVLLIVNSRLRSPDSRT